MTLDRRSKYPTLRTYVLKVRGDATAGALAGRLEHMISGRQVEFSSARELVDCIVNDLHASGGDAPAAHEA